MTIIFRLKLALISFSFLTLSASAYGQRIIEEKELELVNFKTIKKVLEQDGLTKSANQKKKQVYVLKKAKAQEEKNRFLYPTEDELWGFTSEYWLVKNAQVLGWDFEKPDYGLDASFKETMEKLGFYQKKFKILLLNTPLIVRATIPGDGESIHLLSVPFIRSLDLSRLEISLLLLEDYFRMEEGYFKDAVRTEKMKSLASKDFKGTKPNLSLIAELVKNYDHHIYKKGYTFQQQFEITKKMDAHLKSHPELWNVYFRLLGKIERFLKVNVQYKDYVKLYPSPAMQIKWLSPVEKVL